MSFLANNMNFDNKQRLLFEMLRIRRIEEAISARYAEQEMRCPVHLSVGQEAVPVGVSSLLSREDKIVSAHRSHAHYLAKGGSVNSMIAELYGKETGCCKGKGGSMHLFDVKAGQIAAVPIVGSSIPIGTGIAWHEKLKNKKTLVVIYFGDGATEEGAFAESINFASLHSLPIIFVCENNLYSVYSNIKFRQSKNRHLGDFAASHGIQALSGNGNDVIEVQNLVEKGIKLIKDDLGPVFLELSTYRWLEHCGPNWDDQLGYRDLKEVETWLKKCPIENFQKHLRDIGSLSDDLLQSMELLIKKEINDAFLFAKASEFPEPQELFTDVYG